MAGQDVAVGRSSYPGGSLPGAKPVQPTGLDKSVGNGSGAAAHGMGPFNASDSKPLSINWPTAQIGVIGAGQMASGGAASGSKDFSPVEKASGNAVDQQPK